MKYGGSFVSITTMTEKKFYTHEDLLVAMSKLPESEAINILENRRISTILDFINVSSNEQREQLKNNFSETLHRELDIYNGMNRLYDMLPVIEHKVYNQECVVKEDENVCLNSACSDQVDLVK